MQTALAFAFAVTNQILHYPLFHNLKKKVQHIMFTVTINNSVEGVKNFSE